MAALIISICGSFSLNQDACTQALKATIVKTGVESNVQAIESWASNQGYGYFHTYITPITGEAVWVVGASSYRVVRDKQIAYGFRVKSYVDRLSISANPQGGSVNLGWVF